MRLTQRLCMLFTVLALMALTVSIVQAQGVISYGSSASGTLTAETPVTVYTFSGTSGDVVTLSVVSLTPDFVPTVSILSAAGTPITVSPLTLGGVVQYSFELPATGVYTIVLASAGGVGDFALTLSGQPAGTANPVDPATGGSASLDVEQTFSIPAAANDRNLVLTIQPPAPVTATLRGGDSGLYAIQSGSGAVPLQFSVPASASPYTLVVSSTGGAGSTASISLSDVGAPPPPPEEQPPAPPEQPEQPEQPVVTEEVQSEPAPAQQPAETDETSGECRVIAPQGDGVNVRSAPGTGNDVVASLLPGESVTVIGVNEGWYFVEFPNGLQGWVSSDVVFTEGNCDAVLGTSTDSSPTATPTATASATIDPNAPTPTPSETLDPSEPTLTPTDTPSATATYTPSYTPTTTEAGVCEVTPAGNNNVYSEPQISEEVGTLFDGEYAMVLGVNEAWYYVEIPSGTQGWMSSEFVTTRGDCSAYPVAGLAADGLPTETYTSTYTPTYTSTATIDPNAPTPTPSETIDPSLPTLTPSDTPSATATYTPSYTPTFTETLDPNAPTPTYTDTPSETIDPNAPPTATASATATYTPSYTPTTPPAAQIAPEDARFNNPLTIPLDNTASVLDFVSYPGGDGEDRVRFDITGMNNNASVSGGRARLVISASCFGENTDQIQFFTGGQTYFCGQTLVDREVTADSSSGSVVITAIGGEGTYVQWVLTGTATRVN